MLWYITTILETLTICTSYNRYKQITKNVEPYYYIVTSVMYAYCAVPLNADCEPQQNKNYAHKFTEAAVKLNDKALTGVHIMNLLAMIHKVL